MKNGWIKLLVVLISATACSGCEELEEKDQALDAPVINKEDEAIREKARGSDTIVYKKPQKEWITYTIPQGEHNNDLRVFEFFQQDSLEFNFIFDSTAVYSTQDPRNQADWNKLMGFSDCGNFHHTNSIRFVWRYTEKDSVEIGEYRYQSGERQFSTIGNVAIGDTSFGSIIAGSGSYTMKLNDLQIEMTRNCNTRSGSYWLYPYFGGDELAPHDINIHVQHLTP